jgi:hypothetical protein
MFATIYFGGTGPAAPIGKKLTFIKFKNFDDFFKC